MRRGGGVSGQLQRLRAGQIAAAKLKAERKISPAAAQPGQKKFTIIGADFGQNSACSVIIDPVHDSGGSESGRLG